MDLRSKLMACTRQELIDRFGGHGVKPSTLKGLPKSHMVDFLIEHFGTEYPPPPLDPATAARVAADNEKRFKELYEKLFR